MAESNPVLQRFFFRQHVLDMTGWSYHTLRRELMANRFPQPVYISPKCHAWLESELIEWQQKIINNRQASEEVT